METQINQNVFDVGAIAKNIADANHAPRDPSTAAAGANEPYIVIKGEDGAERIESLEHLLANPTRKKGTINFADAASFTTYIAKHKTESTELFGTLSHGSFTAVIDHHSTTTAGWGQHEAKYNCPQSREWQVWTQDNKAQMKQEQFAQFIEDNLLDIIEPASADMLEISRSLEAKKKVNFKSGIRLSNGEQQIAYEESIEGSTSKNNLTIPESFFIAIPVLTGGEPYRIEARLRYRISDSAQLTMWYDLVRPHKSFEDAVQAAWEQVETATEQKILHVE